MTVYKQAVTELCLAQARFCQLGQLPVFGCIIKQNISQLGEQYFVTFLFWLPLIRIPNFSFLSSLDQPELTPNRAGWWFRCDFTHLLCLQQPQSRASNLLGKPSKLEHGKTWGKFPTGGGGQKKFPSFTWEFSKSSQVHKKNYETYNWSERKLFFASIHNFLQVLQREWEYL